MVLVIEGLVYALAPSLVERMLEALRAMPLETRRTLGLATLASGLILLWIFRN
ncbi:Putative inner membrane protein YjeT (clustered with HflC) [Salipiger mucosus DSM 16094]|uniref:Putative inner membrane protein YjeT (Clustered with HflC) n=2 Tax=Salipiger mucosus TaxID=263378 RepID=S9RXY1_9RHOB|nr:Putative inner membrane protein YjeT (clustered with HflC) [Salipiger mucosus DSM 16094]